VERRQGAGKGTVAPNGEQAGPTGQQLAPGREQVAPSGEQVAPDGERTTREHLSLPPRPALEARSGPALEARSRPAPSAIPATVAALVQRLRGDGYEPVVRVVRDLRLVQVGAFRTRAAAARLVAELRARRYGAYVP
jgi:cell division septation protein DedD